MKAGPRRVVPWLIASVCLGLPVSAARAGDDEPAWRAAARIAPPETRVWVLLQDTAAVRRSPAGPTLSAMLAAALPLTTASDAWPALARGAGLDAGEAFDALLGGWALGVAVRARDEEATRWCIASAVERPIAVRLLRSLGAKPQAIEAGRPVAQIENGRFTVAAVLRSRHAVLLLAPTHSGALFGDMLARLDGKSIAPSLADNARFREVASEGAASASVRVMIRAEQPPPDEGAPPAEVWTGLAASASGMTVRLDLTVAPATAEHADAALDPAGWADASQGAVLAAIEPLTPDAQAVGAVVRALELDPGFMLERPTGAFGVFLTETQPDRAAIAVAAQTPARARMAGVADTALARAASHLADEPAEAFRTLDGAFPSATRHLRVPLRPIAREWLGWVDSDGDSLSLVWSLPASADGEDAGWWIASTDERLHARLARALPPHTRRPTPDADPGPDTFLAVRPRDLVRLLQRAGLVEEELPPVLASLSLVDSIEGMGRYAEGLFRLSATASLRPTDDAR